MEPTNRSQPVTQAPAARGDVVRIAIAGPRLDTASGRALLRDAEAALAAGASALVIDLASVGYMDSVGVAALAAIKRRARGSATVVLAAMTPYVQTVARVTHLAQLFDVYATADAALRSLRQS